ncbi:hypothetical protein CLF_102105 [Clonorchis sinensis]|uniref:Uncharacterized protein n=1 Tax=Clonorchis sinensis TaxID=79923 RepID=G7Y7B0_CLOSI|nr:hypothetical protein CLF_102105 [Clonorchis sinensis]
MCACVLKERRTMRMELNYTPILIRSSTRSRLLHKVNTWSQSETSETCVHRSE